MKLYWSKASPYVRKVMVVAHECGLAGAIERLHTIVAMSEANCGLLPDNPLSQIPTLVLADGATLHDSRVICEYLDTLHQGARLFPAEGAARWDALKRQALGDGMLDALIVWRQERLRPADRQTQAWLDTFALKIATTLDQLDAGAAIWAARPFDIGHAALGAAFGYLDFRFGDLAWRSARPALAGWHASFEARPSARATHPGEPT